MNDPQLRVGGQADWKLALVRLIEAIIWPAATVAIAVIFREPIYQLISALARKLGH